MIECISLRFYQTQILILMALESQLFGISNLINLLFIVGNYFSPIHFKQFLFEGIKGSSLCLGTKLFSFYTQAHFLLLCFEAQQKYTLPILNKLIVCLPKDHISMASV